MTEYLDNPTFTQWLHFRKRYKPLHAFIATNPDWPVRARSLPAVLRFARAHSMHIATEHMLRLAFNAYERDMEKGVKVPKRLGPPALPKEKRRRLQSYSVAPTTDEKIVDLQRAMDLDGKGQVIDALVEKAHARKFAR